MTQGPNVKKLISTKMSIDAIPDGGGLADGLAFLSDPKRMIDCAKSATEWVKQAIHLIRTAAEPNPWKDADDETIAGHVLEQVKAKRKGTTCPKTTPDNQ